MEEKTGEESAKTVPPDPNLGRISASGATAIVKRQHERERPKE